MLEIRMHARGGQGAVLLGRMLATAFFWEGNHVQTFPSFGAERRGSPVMVFLRVQKDPIRERCSMLQPDAIIVLSSNLFEEPDLHILEGVKPGGFVVVNTDKIPEKVTGLRNYKIAPFDCNRIAIEYKLGTPPTVIVNTVMLGAFARITGLVSFQGVEVGLKRWINEKIVDRNLAAAHAAYETANPYFGCSKGQEL